MYEVEILHQFSSRILQNVLSDRQTYEMTIQTTQTVQCDVRSTLPVNLGIYFCQKFNLEMAIFRF